MKTFAVVIYISLFEIFFKMGYKKVASRNCAMPYCTNSWYTLDKWMKIVCAIYNTNYGTGSCICPPQLSLSD